MRDVPVRAKQCSFQYSESYILALMTFSIRNCSRVSHRHDEMREEDQGARNRDLLEGCYREWH